MRGKKNLFVVFVVSIILVTTLLLSACPAETEVIELSLAYPYPPTTTPGMVYEALAQKIGEETDGRVKVTTYPAEALVKYADTYDGVAGGIADMGHWFPQLNPAFELTGAITLPGISWAEGYEGRYNALREVFVNVPEIREEFKGTEPLSLYLAAPSIIIFREDKAVLTPADMKGMKIGSTSSEAAMLEALGGVPVIMTPPDLYLSLERGVVDAAICMYGTVNSLRLYEVAKTYTEDIYLPRPLSTAIINQEVWDNLPSDLQEIIGDLGDWASIELSKGYNEEADYMRETILESSPEAINIPSPEQKELWLGALIPVQDAWAEKLEAKGLPARAVLDETLRIIGEGG